MNTANADIPAVFDNRGQAGELLAQRLREYAGSNAIVLGLPRGGVPVAAEIAKALALPLDIVLVRKIGAPGQPELALGAVSNGSGMQMTANPDVAAALGVGEAHIERLARELLPELQRREERFRGGRRHPPLKGRTVIVVDDGVATGATMRASLQIIRRQEPEKLVLALPVAPPETLSTLEQEADEVVCLKAPRDFYAVGAHYRDFDQIEDDEVAALLKAFSNASSAGAND